MPLTITNLPDEQWDRFIQRAWAEGWAMGPLVKQLMRDYGNRAIDTTRGPDPIEQRRTPPSGWRIEEALKPRPEAGT